MLVFANVELEPFTERGVELGLEDWKAEDSAARESDVMGPGFSCFTGVGPVAWNCVCQYSWC